MLKSEETIKAITRDLHQRLALFDAESFVHKIASIPTHLDKTYKALLQQYDSRIFFGDTIEDSQLTEYEYNSFQLMRIIALVAEGNNHNINELQGIIASTANKSDLPDWLKERVIAYLPPLLIKKYPQDSTEQSSLANYLVFMGGEIKRIEKESLDIFKEEHPPGSFDIFIENTDYVSIYIKNRTKLFRAGDYHPFNILTLFLQRLGKSLSYQEIYHLAIKPNETTRPRDHSKKVYDYLKIIKKTVAECEEISIDPEEWFQRDHKKGIVHISKAINSCLITTDQRLLI